MATSIVTKAKLLALAAFLLTPALVSAQTVGEYQSKARQDCLSLRPKVNTLVTDFASATKYQNLQSENAALRASLATQAATLKANLDAWCTTMQGAFADAPAALAAYNQLKASNLREVFLPLYAKVGELESYYGKQIALERSLDNPAVAPVRSSGLRKDRDDFAGFNNPAIIGATTDASINAAVTGVETELARAATLAPTAADYTAIFTQSEIQARISLPVLSDKVRSATQAIANGQRQYQQGRVLMTDKLTKAAWDNISKDVPLKSPEYAKIYDANRPKVDRIKASAVSAADRDLRTLNSLWVPAAGAIPASGALTDANTVHMTAALRTNLRNRVVSARTALTTARTALLAVASDQYYAEIAPQLTAIQQLKLNVRIPAIEAAVSFHGDLVTLRGATTANLDTETGLVDVQAGMTNAAKRGPVEAAIPGDPLIAQFASALAAIDFVPLTALQTALETEITQVINPTNSTAATFVHATSEASLDKAALAEVRTALSNYRRTLGAERKDVTVARNIWLAMVTKAANSGSIADLTPYANDLRTKKILDDFNANRQGLKEKVAAIVNNRKAAIDRNQASVASVEPNILAAHRIAFATHTATIKTQLDDFRTAADAIDNYEDLKAKVLELKNLGVNNVYLPAQRLYISAASHYPRQSILKQVNDILIARATALPATVVERDLLIAEANALNTRIMEVEASLGAALTGPLTSTVTTREAATADSLAAALGTLEEARSQLRGISSEVSALRGLVSNLLTQIKAAERSTQ